jgi:DNA-binding MarR family transcriptional regulator
MDLFALGRRLMRLGIEAVPPGGFRDLPTSVRMVLVDVFEHPGTTIGGIVERTGFPQSHVSTSVSRLRERGVLVTGTDPLDRRRTVVAPSPGMPARIARARDEMPPVDDVLAAALTDRLGPDGADRLAETVAALEALDALLVARPAADPARSTC